MWLRTFWNRLNYNPEKILENTLFKMMRSTKLDYEKSFNLWKWQTIATK